jgi:hypothetical protein
MGRHKDDYALRGHIAGVLEHLDAIGARHHQIGKNYIRVKFIYEINRHLSVHGFMDLIALAAKQLRKTFSRRILIFDN